MDNSLGRSQASAGLRAVHRGPYPIRTSLANTLHTTFNDKRLRIASAGGVLRNTPPLATSDFKDPLRLKPRSRAHPVSHRASPGR